MQMIDINRQIATVQFPVPDEVREQARCFQLVVPQHFNHFNQNMKVPGFTVSSPWGGQPGPAEGSHLHRLACQPQAGERNQRLFTHICTQLTLVGLTDRSVVGAVFKSIDDKLAPFQQVLFIGISNLISSVNGFFAASVQLQRGEPGGDPG